MARLPLRHWWTRIASSPRIGRGRADLRVEQLEARQLLSSGFFDDFSTDTAPIQTGYRRIGLDTYQQSTRYGLEETNGARIVDRGEGAGNKLNTNLTRAFLTGTDNSFRVDTPNTRPDGNTVPDTYSLTVYLGDQLQAHYHMRIYVQGIERTPAEGITTSAGGFVTANYPVTVYNTGDYADHVGIRITGQDPGGYSLNGFSLTWVGDETVAASSAGVSAAGIKVFPDTGLGMLKNQPVEGQPQTYTFFGAGGDSYGSVTMRSVGTVQDLFGLSLPP